MQHERVARCEVAVLHLAKFGNGRVRCSGATPCDLFLSILRDFGGNAKVNANIRLRVFGTRGTDVTSGTEECKMENERYLY